MNKSPPAVVARATRTRVQIHVEQARPVALAVIIRPPRGERISRRESLRRCIHLRRHHHRVAYRDFRVAHSKRRRTSDDARFFQLCRRIRRVCRPPVGDPEHVVSRRGVGGHLHVHAAVRIHAYARARRAPIFAEVMRRRNAAASARAPHSILAAGAHVDLEGIQVSRRSF